MKSEMQMEFEAMIQAFAEKHGINVLDFQGTAFMTKVQGTDGLFYQYAKVCLDYLDAHE